MHLWRTNLYLIVQQISFLPLLLRITAENRTKLKKLFIWATKSGRIQHHTKKKKHCIWLFISNYNNASDIFELNETSGLSLIAGIHSTNLKTHERANNFFNPTNTQSSSEESLKEKRKMFIGMCSLSHTEFISWHRRIHNPLKYLKWSILQKQSTIKSCQLFLQNAPS